MEGLRGFVWVAILGFSTIPDFSDRRLHHREHLEPQVLFVA